MGKIAFVFSGQGAQRPGMGQDFYNHSPAARQLFEQAEQYRPGTIQQCFSGDPAQLKDTKNAQPCLYLTDLAAALAVQEAGITPDAAAGFSLGEIPSLAFAGAYSPMDGFAMACKRGELMAAAAEQFPATMAAVLKLENRVVEQLCSRYRQLYPVNYNAPGQLVVSGTKEQLEQLKQDVIEAGGRLIPLAVSGGFHSPFMDTAAKGFGEYLQQVNIQKPTLTAYSNYTAAPYGDNVRELLTKQINHSVQWEAIITHMTADGFDTFIEVGVGATLQKLIQKITPTSRSLAVEDWPGLQQALQQLG